MAAGPAAALPGPLGALFADSPAAGCITNAVDNECSDTAPIGGAADVAISPAGAHAYVAASDNSTLIGLATDGVGAPTRAGAACVSSAALVSCSPAIGLGGIASVAVSPDGSHVYTAAPGVSAVAAFVRDTVTGALAQAAAPCVADEIPGVPDPQPSELGCVAVQGLAGAADVAVSPDGCRIVEPAPAAAGCLAAAGLNDPTAIALSPDGANAYVTSAEAGTVASFRRDGTTGALVPVAGGCLADTAALVGPAAGCNAATGLVGAVDVVVTADGMHVHVAANQADAVASFLRDPVNGALTQLPAPHSCLSAAGLAGCAQASRLSGASALALTPGGRHLVVTARSGAVLSLERQLAPICAPTFVAGIVGPTPVPLPCADPNGDPLTFQVLSSPQRGTVIAVDHASGAATYAPGVGAAGHDTFSFAARDDGGAAGAPALASLELATQATAALRVKAAKDVRAPQLRSSKLVFASHRRLRVKLRCPTHEAFGCRGTISIKTARRIPVRILRNARLAAGPRAIARRVVFVRKLRFSLKGASTRTVSTSLKKKHLRLLKRIGRTRVDVTLVARDVAGNVAKSKRRVVLQPPKPS